MENTLSRGAVASLMNGEEVTNPVFQIMGFKKIAGNEGSERYRLNISDGVHCHTFAMLATQLNHMIPSGELEMYSIIRCDNILSNAVKEKRVLIIVALTVLQKGKDIARKLGNPMQWNESMQAARPAPVVQNVNGVTNRPMPAANEIRAQPNSAAASFYGARTTTNNAAPPSAPTNTRMAPPAGNPAYGDFSGNVMPIRDVTPYNNKCALRARITKKAPVRSWTNAKGEGKVFSIDLLDDSSEIRMSGFTNAVDQFYDMLEENHVYYIKNFSVKNADKRWSSLAHDYEIQFINETQVFPCLEDSSDIPNVTFNFVDIASIEAAETGSTIDVIGICKRVGELSRFTAKATNKELVKRDVFIVDKTNKEISLTLWGKTAEDFNDESQPVIAAKGVKVSDFGGKSLSLQMSALFQINPDIREAHILRGWYDNEGARLETQSLSTGRMGGPGGGSTWKLLREANDASEILGDPSKSDYFMSKVTIMSFKRDSVMYKACPAADCKKKVIDNNNGLYRCEKCNREFPEFKWRMMLQVDFADCSDHIWATCFQESGEQILGHESEELGKMNTEEPEKFDALLKDVLFKSFIVKFRSKMESFNGENRMKTSVQDLHPLKFSEYAKQLLVELKESATS